MAQHKATCAFCRHLGCHVCRWSPRFPRSRTAPRARRLHARVPQKRRRRCQSFQLPPPPPSRARNATRFPWRNGHCRLFRELGQDLSRFAVRPPARLSLEARVNMDRAACLPSCAFWAVGASPLGPKVARRAKCLDRPSRRNRARLLRRTSCQRPACFSRSGLCRDGVGGGTRKKADAAACRR